MIEMQMKQPKQFYCLDRENADTEAGKAKMLTFFRGKLAVSYDAISREQLHCQYCKKRVVELIEIRIPDDHLYVCGNFHCILTVISEYEIRFLDMIPMRWVRYIDTQRERAKITNSVRWKIIKRDNFRCVACGSNDNLVIDHKTPICQGGTSDIDNLQTLCFRCNSGKGGS